MSPKLFVLFGMLHVVQGVPNIDQVVLKAITDTTATAEWSAPTSCADCTYTVQVSYCDTNVWTDKETGVLGPAIPSAPIMYNLNGLDSGKFFRVRILATNGADTSDALTAKWANGKTLTGFCPCPTTNCYKYGVCGGGWACAASQISGCINGVPMTGPNPTSGVTYCTYQKKGTAHMCKGTGVCSSACPSIACSEFVPPPTAVSVPSAAPPAPTAAAGPTGTSPTAAGSPTTASTPATSPTAAGSPTTATAGSPTTATAGSPTTASPPTVKDAPCIKGDVCSMCDGGCDKACDSKSCEASVVGGTRATKAQCDAAKTKENIEADWKDYCTDDTSAGGSLFAAINSVCVVLSLSSSLYFVC